MKMYREHAIGHNMLNKHEFQAIAGMVNEKKGHAALQDEALKYDGFVEFFAQAAVYCSGQGRIRKPRDVR